MNNLVYDSKLHKLNVKQNIIHSYQLSRTIKNTQHINLQTLTDLIQLT